MNFSSWTLSNFSVKLLCFGSDSISHTVVEVEDSIVFPPQCMIQTKCSKLLSSSMMTNNILSTELFMCGGGLSLPIHRKKGWQATGTAGECAHFWCQHFFVFTSCFLHYYCINLIGIYFDSKYGTLFISCFLVNDYYGKYKKLIVLVNFYCTWKCT